MTTRNKKEVTNKMKRIWKPIGSLLLALCMIITMLPATAFAGDPPEGGGTGIDITDDFKDQAFLNYLLGENGCDINKDGRIYDVEADTVLTLSVDNLGIEDLAGIENFKNLETLGCSKSTSPSESDKYLKSIDVSKNAKLKSLTLNGNMLTTLDVSQNPDLEELSCIGVGWEDDDVGHLTSLDVSKNTKLKTLNCSYAQITSLDLSKNTELTDLKILATALEGIDLRANAKLETLTANGTGGIGKKLKTLDVTKNTALKTLSCFYNELTSLDVSKNTELIELNCGSNQLQELDVSNNTKLERLSCFSNQLTSLDVTNNTALTELQCSYNIIPSEAQVTGREGKNILLMFPPQNIDITDKLTDEIFRNAALAELKKLDPDTTKILASAAAQIRSLDLSGKGIEDLSGIKYFTGLTGLLNCSGNQLTTLDVSGLENLRGLDCSNNQLTELKVTGTGLVSLDCSHNQLTGLDVTGLTTLVMLKCAYNKMANQQAVTGTDGLNLGDSFIFSPQTGIDITDKFTDPTFRAKVRTALGLGASDPIDSAAVSLATDLNVSYTTNGSDSKITSLAGIEYFTELTTLNCGGNELEALDMSHTPKLAKLICSDNKLTSLDVSDNPALVWLDCNGNELTALDVSHNPGLVKLYCHNNELTTLDVSKNPELDDLTCFLNYMTDTSKVTGLAYTKLLNAENEHFSFDNQKEIPKNSITVTGGTASPNPARLGETVTITAAPAPDGKQFANWTVISGGVALDNSQSTTATFIMPKNAVEVAAVYNAIPVIRTITVGAQSGAVTAGTAGSVTFPVTVKNIPDGIYSVSLDSAPAGVTAKDITIASGGGTLTLSTADATPTGSYSMTAAIDGEVSNSFTLTVSKPAGGNGSHGGGGGSSSSSNSAALPAAPPATPSPAPGQKAEPPVTNPDAPGKMMDTTDHWGKEAIDYVLSRGLFSGTSETAFSPDSSMTRAMVWTVLARLDGQSTAGGSTWYALAQDWAKANDISDGSMPQGSITREQLVSILYRYAGLPAASRDLSGFADAGQISGWASDAMQWAVENGLIVGADNRLNPAGNATRAEVSAILMRYIKLISN